MQDENKEISLTEAQKIEPDYEVGEDVSEPVDFTKFGRRAILNLRQTLASKVLELEHDSLYNKYKDRIGQVIAGEVYQVWKREVLVVDDENNELILPKSEQIPNDVYHKGETVRAVIERVDNDNNNPKIILSRTAPPSCNVCSKLRCPRLTTASYRLNASHVCQASAQRLL